MSMYNPTEIMERFSAAGKRKADRSVHTLLLLSFLAGFLVAAGGLAGTVASAQAETASQVRLISGLIFPFGLGMVMLTGAELFTGNTMLTISLCDRKINFLQLLRSWGLVYFGNLCGALFMAVLCVFCGTLEIGNGAVGLSLIQSAAAKTAMPFTTALGLGILCNILVCIGVLCSLSARDTAGRIVGAYLPVALFVICGFEHSIANMLFIPSALMAMTQPVWVERAAEINTDTLTLSGMLGNLLPVTLGNLIGGMGVGLLLWISHRISPPRPPEQKEECRTTEPALIQK